MEFTEHASKRSQQRGISPELVEVMKMYGEHCEQKGGDGLLRMDRRAIKRFMRDMQQVNSLLNRKTKPYAIVNADRVITVFHQSRKIRTL